MNYFESNVVVIDDKIEEVQGIIDYYREAGVGCKYFNADPSEGPGFPDKCMSDVTLLFLDLYYSENTLGNNSDLEMPVDWVRSVIPPKAFYILIIWTKDTTQADTVLELLSKEDINPYLSIVEGKEKYINKDTLAYEYSSLLDSINRKIEEVSALEEIQIWKNTLKKTSNIVLGGLISENTEEFTHKLRKIVQEHGGRVVRSKDYPNMAKRALLFEALNSVLISNAPQYISENDISEANQSGLYNTSQKSNVSIDKELNSWFHFILKDDLKGQIFPGIIAKNNSSFLRNHYSIIKEDSRIQHLLKAQMENEANGTVIEDIVVNITRPCDYAQKKYGKNLKLLSGLAIKNPKRGEPHKKDPKKENPDALDLGGNQVPDCVKIFDHLYYDKNDKDLTLIFDFRYCFSVPESVFLSRFENIKMLNKELLSEIQVSYSSYVSRLGFTKIF